jgi:hypothetical protein
MLHKTCLERRIGQHFSAYWFLHAPGKTGNILPVHLLVLAHLQLHEKSNAACNNILNFASLCYKQRSYMVQEYSSIVLAIYS